MGILGQLLFFHARFHWLLPSFGSGRILRHAFRIYPLHSPWILLLGLHCRVSFSFHKRIYRINFIAGCSRLYQRWFGTQFKTWSLCGRPSSVLTQSTSATTSILASACSSPTSLPLSWWFPWTKSRPCLPKWSSENSTNMLFLQVFAFYYLKQTLIPALRCLARSRMR